jgi:hypothetical protein
MKITALWAVTLCNSEPPVGFLLALAYPSTLKIETIFSSGMSDVFLFTRLYIITLLLLDFIYTKGIIQIFD